MIDSIWDNTINQAIYSLQTCTNKDKKYILVANCFQNSIQSNDVSINTALPSQRQLSSALNLTLATINRVYQHLALLSFIQNLPGKGSFTCYQIQTQSNSINESSLRFDTRKLRCILMNDNSFASSSSNTINTDIQQILDIWFDQLHMPSQDRKTRLTSNIYESLDFCFSTLLTSKDTVLCLNLTHPGISKIALNHQVKLKSLSFKNDELNIAVIEQYCKIYQPKAFFIHSHTHTPTGLTLSNTQKNEIAVLCKKYQVFIIEDASLNWLERPKLNFSNLLPDTTISLCSTTVLFDSITHYCAIQYPNVWDFDFQNIIQSQSNINEIHANSYLKKLFTNGDFFNSWQAKHSQLNDFVFTHVFPKCKTIASLKQNVNIFLGIMWIECEDEQSSEQLKMALGNQEIISLTQEIFLFDYQPQWLKPFNSEAMYGVRLCFAHLPFPEIDKLFLLIDQCLFDLSPSLQYQRHDRNHQYPNQVNMP
ncbi:aminotransferase class I/II-fold pyridoxal phosphate-dependent enzyme [Marinicellulosiphila megalodicopiae]|uniref:aminotransferase class I/II-fold pyridoxal phosphate-dependent enzyme n=1 Tax=Marinicellulosiphila megalodicopiae TaxID=2724896 RepID=UPI003BB1AFC6